MSGPASCRFGPSECIQVNALHASESHSTIQLSSVPGRCNSHLRLRHDSRPAFCNECDATFIQPCQTVEQLGTKSLNYSAHIWRAVKYVLDCRLGIDRCAKCIQLDLRDVCETRMRPFSNDRGQASIEVLFVRSLDADHDAVLREATLRACIGPLRVT